MNRILGALVLTVAALAAQAQTAPAVVQGAWARASVPGQSGTGAFMTITASQPLQLVGASTPAAGVAEVHEMRMEGDVMRMRAVESVALPAGKPVELKPGGYHVMLMQLKAPLAPDTQLPLTLLFRDAQGRTSRLEVSVPVAMRAPAAQHGAGHKH